MNKNLTFFKLIITLFISNEYHGEDYEVGSVTNYKLGIANLGVNPSDIHWVYTTGFAGGDNGDGTLSYLQKTICSQGENTITLRTTPAEDSAFLNHVICTCAYTRLYY